MKYFRLHDVFIDELGGRFLIKLYRLGMCSKVKKQFLLNLSEFAELNAFLF
jgi:hypothetical protein